MEVRRGLAPALIFAALVTSLISALGAPLIPTIAHQMHVSLSVAQWSLTVALLSGAVSAPILGRLGDGPRQRGALLGGLTVVVLGCVLAAVASNLVLIVVGRALQGVGLGLLPLTMAVAREHLPTERAASTISVLSVSAAAGVGVGYPVSGLIADHLGLAAGFWFGAIIAVCALVSAAVVVPSNRHAPRVRNDVRGAVLLTGGLIALLLAIAEGNTWGWGTAKVLALAAAATILLAAWSWSQLRAQLPLVQVRLLLNPAVLTCDVCAAVMGVAMYINLPTITEFVQAPRRAGYGFAGSVVVAGLCLIPLSVASLGASRLLPLLLRTVGGWALLPIGCLLVGSADVLFAVLHNSLWQAFGAMALIGSGIGLTSAVIPTLIVRAVPAEETGSALGFFQVVRYIGFSIGSALAATLLAGATPARTSLPRESGYSLVLWVAAAVCVLAACLARSLAGKAERTTTPGDASGLTTEPVEMEYLEV